jgi:hypothetical protein
LMLEVLGHHRGSAAQERERTHKHALVANRYQLRHTATIARGQDGDRITLAGSGELGVPLARYLCAQALAVRITLGERAPGGLGHLACDVKHLKRRTGLAAACALKRRQRDFPTADITRSGISSPSPLTASNTLPAATMAPRGYKFFICARPFIGSHEEPPPILVCVHAEEVDVHTPFVAKPTMSAFPSPVMSASWRGKVLSLFQPPALAP